MKLLIFSDNHRDRDSVKELLQKNPNMDRIFSLGDSEMREHELSALGIVGVRGNYPFEPDFPYELTFDFDGIRILLTHGHKYNVKWGITALMQKAYYENIQIVCFGHTHSIYLKELNDTIFLNPGSLSKPRLGVIASFAIIEITDKDVSIKIFDFNTMKVIKEYMKKR